MARIDTDSIQARIVVTELTSLLKKAETAIQPQLKSGVVFNCAVGAPKHTIKTDPNLLGQVIMNLLANACRFTSQGAITCGYEVYEDEIYFFIKDTGCGLSRDIKDRISTLFEEGAQASQFTGLGLTVAKAIIDKLNGEIGMESRGEGKGSTFWFTIPNDATEAEAKQSVKEGDAPQHSIDSSIKTVLVAEDNESNFILFRSILEREFNVLRAHDGIEALAIFRQQTPDIIIMDINMPNMDGFEAVREIRKLNTQVPVIAATAYAFATDRQRILESGFNGYVAKPINIRRLEQEIKNCLDPNGGGQAQ